MAQPLPHLLHKADVAACAAVRIATGTLEASRRWRGGRPLVAGGMITGVAQPGALALAADGCDLAVAATRRL